MITSRRALLRKLETLAPAVADNDLTPVLVYFIFTGTDLLAYNERIALSVPMASSDFRGAVPAKLLMEVLAASRAPAVEFQGEENAAKLKLGDATVTLAKLPVEDFTNVFQMPPMPKQSLRLPAQFFDGIQHCLRSVSNYATVNDHLGITLIADGHRVKLFATNVATVSYASVELPQPCVIKRPILSTEFCQQMLKLAAQTQTTRLVLRNDYALFVADDVTLYGKLLKSRDPLDFEATIRRHLPKNIFAKMAKPTPVKLRAALNRMVLFTDIKGSEVKTVITIKDEVATLATQSARGIVSDSVAIPGHPPVKIAVNAQLLIHKRAAFDKILFTPSCVIMGNAASDQLYLIASFDD